MLSISRIKICVTFVGIIVVMNHGYVSWKALLI